MTIRFHRDFEKQYQKLHPGEKNKFKERRNIFLENPYHPLLHNHPLKGKYQGYRSINITGDLRVVYKMLDSETALFVLIDTHSNLYK